MTRLLLLACSARKRPDDGALPALARYDGPAFRVVRRFLSDCPDPDLRVIVLSARFGLLEGSDLTPNYDCTMTADRARQLASQVDERLAAIESALRPDDCFALLGKSYLELLTQCSSPLAHRFIARIAPGGQGVKLARLHRWLRMDAVRSSPSGESTPFQPGARSTRAVRFKSQDFTLSSCDLAQLVDRHAGRLPANATESIWKAVVGGRQVAPKWIVSLATGVPVSAFTTGEARRFLTRLGVEIIAP